MNSISGNEVIFRGFNIASMAPNSASIRCELSDTPLCDSTDNLNYGMLHGTAIGVSGGKIKWLALEQELDRNELTFAQTVNGEGKLLTPGLIDCHSHLVFGGNRTAEWEQRLNGYSYEEIAKQGGGILSTVSATRAASEEELFQTAAERIKFLLSEGVTTVEIKSGYGLNLDSELKMLRVANRLGLEFPVSVEATLLAAHAVAPEFKGNPDAFIQHVCDTIIPQSAGLCSSVDAFCETIAFDLTQTKRVFECAQQQGLNIKVHAEQLSHTGAAALAANMGAISADHLEYLSANDCATLSRQGTVATLLPGAFYCLNEKQKPPIAALRDNQVSIAIATDSNPGSSPVLSLLLMGNMACNLFGLTPSEAIAGMTINAAKALKLDQSIGSIEKNKQADFATWNVNSPAEIVYGIGGNPSAGVYKLGKRTQF
jgi:imidazolonepropionase